MDPSYRIFFILSSLRNTHPMPKPLFWALINLYCILPHTLLAMRTCILWCMLLGLGVLSTLSAQTPGAVQLRSGPVMLSDNLGRFVADPIPLDDIVASRYYRYVQFQETPGAATRQALSSQGLRFLAYVPKATYLVSFPATYDRSQLQAHGVHAVLRPGREQQIAPRLVEGTYPDYALHGRQLDLTVVYPAEVPASLLVGALRDLGATILRQTEGDQTLDLRIDLDRLFDVAALPAVLWVEAISDPGEPEDELGRSLSRANVIDAAHPAGRQYDGTGIRVLVRDDGAVGPHIDFTGRLMINSTNTNLGSTHADGVAGVMAGAGNLDPLNAGTATGSEVYVLDYNSTFTDQTLSLHQDDSVMITNSSYSNGCNAGYTTTTERVDRQIHDNPSLLHVFSAGNSNNQNCGYGAGNQWGNITGGHKMGKNTVTVANLFSDGALVNSSSRGPANDGRIKPDLAAHGQGQPSTDPNNGYQSFGGTSAAAPTAAGSFAQLYQAYREMHSGAFPPSALIKALMLNTADDYGNPGPDFRFGWGRVNAYRALLSLEAGQYLVDSIAQADTNLHSITVPSGVTELRVMVYWNDPEASPAAARALVNNLDMVLDDGSAQSLPLVLDPTPNPATLNQPAVPGIDSLNNMEQVRLANPAAGTYTLQVTGSDVPFGPQEYFVVYEFIGTDITLTYPYGGEGLVPGEIARIHWDAAGDTGSFALEYTLDNGSTWNPIATVSGSDRMYDWIVPSVVSGQARVRISRGAASSESAYPFSIIAVPTNVQVLYACTEKAQLSWNAVPGAVAYEVYRLGDRYMDSVLTTTTTVACVPVVNPSAEQWFAVSAVPANGRTGRRSLAEPYVGTIQPCADDDLAAIQLLTPADPTVSLCFDDSLRIRFLISNLGDSTLSGFDLGYQLSQGPGGSQTYSGQLGSCGFDEGSFAAPLGNLAPGIYTLKVWTSLASDPNSANDTLRREIRISGLPLGENFDLFALCSTDPNCAEERCELANGWRNVTNGLEDDIDWRVHSGPTPSTGTGPATDQNLGSALGKYLYIESSGTCSNQEAILQSPCIDLSSAITPTMTFWYHMFGSDIASLHVDVNDGTGWDLDVMPALAGAQSFNWLLAPVDLSAYAGQQIQVRFRAYTGNDFASDIAIDNIQVYDQAAPPTSDFATNVDTVCPVEVVRLRSQTIPTPQTYAWSFTPNDVVYLNGTDSTSANPIVSLPSLGSYDVRLVTGNANGEDTLGRSAFIEVVPGGPLPMADDFEGELLCSTASDCEAVSCELSGNWYNLVSGIEDQIDWRVNSGETNSNDTGPTVDRTTLSTLGKYLYLEASTCFGREGILESRCIDLVNYPTAVFSFWYHMYGTDMGSLHIDVKHNGSWDLDVVPPITGNQGDIWQPMRVNLTPYGGEEIQIRVRAFTGAGFRSDIALDDMLVEFVQPPVAQFTEPSALVCRDSVVLLADSSGGDDIEYVWDFGQDATPATATTAGPHTVSWSSLGSKQVSLIVSNEVGADTLLRDLDVIVAPQALFGRLQITPDSFVFLRAATPSTTSVTWDFGDGTTLSTTDTTVSHVYQADGDYTVTLILANTCGSDTFSQRVNVTTVGLGTLAGLRVGLAPNPNGGQFTVQVQGETRGEVSLRLLDLRGRAVHEQTFTFGGGQHRESVAVDRLPEGVYLLRLQLAGQTAYRRVMIK